MVTSCMRLSSERTNQIANVIKLIVELAVENSEAE